MSTNLDIGPIEGMNYTVRQRFDASVKEGRSQARIAVQRVCERRNEEASPVTTVVAGSAAFVSQLKYFRLSRVLTAGFAILALFSAVLTYLVAAEELAFGLGWHVPALRLGGRLFSTGEASVFLTSSVLVSLMSLILTLVRRQGYDSHMPYFIRRFSKNCWVIGTGALIISRPEDRGDRAVVTTVFYDSIGAVDIDENDEGIDVVTIRSRDGSVISEMVSPVTSEVSNARVIADVIADRAAASRCAKQEA